MAVFPFIPQAEPTEAMEWYSGVIRPYSTEQRQRFTDAPRSAFQFDYQFDAQQFSRARAMTIGASHTPFSLPIWTDLLSIGSWPAGQDTLEIDASVSDFRIGDQALLIQDDQTWEVLEVVDGGGGAVDVEAAAPTAVTYSPAYIVPLRQAYLAKGFGASRQHPVISPASLTWSIVGGIDLSAAHDFDTYRGYPVFADRTVLLSSFDDEFERILQAVDNGIADPYYSPETAQAEHRSTAAWSCQTRAELWRVRQWLHTCKGRQKAFWMPSWSNDFVLTANISSAHTVLHIEHVGYTEYYTTLDLMILKTNGNRVYLRATDGNLESGGEYLTLTGAVGQNITMAEVDMICILSLMRFDSDRFEIKHRAGGGGDLITRVVEAPNE